MRTSKQPIRCPKPACERVLTDLGFESEEALVSSGQLVRKPLAVERNFVASCPDHGSVWLAASGHHVSSEETVGYELIDSWQAIAFAVRNVDRKSEKRSVISGIDHKPSLAFGQSKPDEEA